jgi:two-component system sensor histidine kinase BaeS
VTGLLERLKPRTIRARVAIAIVVALGVVSGLVIGFDWIVQGRARAEVEEALQQQAEAIAKEIDREGITSAAGEARNAERFIGDARMVVLVQGEVVHWSDPVSDLEARATARSGDVEVIMERPDPSAAVSDWVIPALVIGGIAIAGALVWALSSGVASRLRRSVSELADSAEAVTHGRFDTRVHESDDELGRLGQSFNRMTERLEAADARQREFLADVAHELRTPVTAIEGFATALGDGTAATPEERAEAAEFIRAEAVRLRELVRELQELTWLDLEPKVRAEPVDLAAAARECVSRLGIDAHIRGIELAGPEGELPAVGDPDHLQTILGNLVTNALRATPAGGSVRLETRTGPGEVGIAVCDTGRGIAPEHLPYIFDRLYRVDTSRDRDAGGSGLGLSIVQRLATLLAGRVTAESTVGAGSVFTLWLPARPVAPPRRARVGSGPA